MGDFKTPNIYYELNNTVGPPYIFRQGASKNSFQFCAGVVINKIQILSAAHCFEGMPKSSVIIISNMYEPKKTGDPKDWGYPWFKIKDVKIHEDHGRKDLAIVTIEDSYRVDSDAAVLGDMGHVLQVKPAILEIENNHPSSKFICTFRGP